MRIALFQPDIPQNTGTILRLAACLGVEAHIIEPTGFPSSDRAFRRAGMDYLDQVTLRRHSSWTAFDAWRRTEAVRLILFTTAGAMPYLEYAYRPGDILMFGSGKLAGALLQLGLVDELRFLVYPVVLGSGQRFFEQAPHVTLQTVEARDMDRGVTLLRYVIQN